MTATEDGSITLPSPRITDKKVWLDGYAGSPKIGWPRGLPKVQIMIGADSTKAVGFYDRLRYDQVPRVVMERWLLDAPGTARRTR